MKRLSGLSSTSTTTGIYSDGLVRATFGGNPYAECTRRSSSPEPVLDPALGAWAPDRIRLAGGAGTRAVR